VHEPPLLEEQIEALRLDRALLQLFLSESEVEPVGALWIVCIEVAKAVPGRHSRAACTEVADDSIVNWFIAFLVCLNRYSWLVGFSSAGEPCLVRCFLRYVASKLLATDRSLFAVQLVGMPIHWRLFRPEVFMLPFFPDCLH
jgi:hypothetical protein